MLLFAAWSGDRKTLETLVRRDEDITMQDNHGWTALHLAVWTMQVDSVKFLLGIVDKRLWVSAGNIEGVSSLHLATCNNDLEVLELLLNAGADVEAKNADGETPLHQAAKNGHADAIKALKEAGADVEAKNADGETPLHLAAKNGHADAIKALKEAGADVAAQLYLAAE